MPFVTVPFSCYNGDTMRHLFSFFDGCLKFFTVLLCVLAHLLFGWQFVLLIGRLGQEQLARATLKKLYYTHKQLHWGVKPYNLRYSLFRGGKISIQTHFVEWKPITKRMWTYYTLGEIGK